LLWGRSNNDSTMKKLFLISLLFPIAFFLVVSGCSKSNSSNNNRDSSDTVESKMTMMTKEIWKYDTSGINTDMSANVEIADTTVTPCVKEYTYQFNPDSTGVLTEGATKCSPTDPQTTPFTWSFNTSQTALQASFNPVLAGGVNILSLTDSSLVVYKDSAYLGIPFRYIISLKH
jgi:hypothetical protein